MQVARSTLTVFCLPHITEKHSKAQPHLTLSRLFAECYALTKMRQCVFCQSVILFPCVALTASQAPKSRAVPM